MLLRRAGLVPGASPAAIRVDQLCGVHAPGAQAPALATLDLNLPTTPRFSTRWHPGCGWEQEPRCRPVTGVCARAVRPAAPACARLGVPPGPGSPAVRRRA